MICTDRGTSLSKGQNFLKKAGGAPANVAAAIAALNDAAYLKKSAEVNAQGYQQLTSVFDSMKIAYLPSSGNFVLFRAGQDDGAGARVNLALLKKGIIVRPVGNYGLPQWLRVSIGLPEENEAFLVALKSVLA